jgi:excinuclease ABC subunit C
VRELISFTRQFIPLRTCKLPLTTASIAKGKYKVCLEYHLGNCKGPCEGLQTEEDYAEGLQQVRQMLKGNLSPIMQSYKSQMGTYAANLQFERAEMVRKKLEHLENYQARSVIVSKHLGNLDVFSILKDGDVAYVNYLIVQNGTVVQTHTVELQPRLEETDEEVLAFAVASLKETFNPAAGGADGGGAPQEIVVPFEIEFPDQSVVVTVPKGGDRKKLLELSEKNVNYFREEIRKKKTLKLEGKSDMEKKKVLYQLQEYLKLPEVPVHIECFDNSNFQGSFPVSAMVCFRDGVPFKKDYRHFNVKTVEGINDFATMAEVVHRRYKRLADEKTPLPQLVIIDGGKGQLGAAMQSIRQLGLVGQMTVVGLAKNEEELFFPGDVQSLKLPWDSDALKLVRSIRDEVHRFGITFHRNKRSKGTFVNELEDIKGIGKNTATLLLQQFKSVKNMRTKTLEELEAVVGKAKANLLWQHWQK